jgi:hypothetical protein
MQLKRLAPSTWQTGSRTIFQEIVSGSRYIPVVVVAVSLDIRLIEFRCLCTRIMDFFFLLRTCLAYISLGGRMMESG